MDILRILRQSPAFLSLIDPQYHLVWCNRIGYGLVSQNILNRPSEQQISPEDVPRWHVYLRRVFELRETVDYTVRCLVPQPPGYLTLTGVLGPHIEGNAVRYAIAVCRDTTLRQEKTTAGRFLLSPLARLAVRALWPTRALKGAAIGNAIGERASNGQATPRLRALLADLIERGILTHSAVTGYRISVDFLPLATDLIA